MSSRRLARNTAHARPVAPLAASAAALSKCMARKQPIVLTTSLVDASEGVGWGLTVPRSRRRTAARRGRGPGLLLLKIHMAALRREQVDGSKAKQASCRDFRGAGQ